MKKLSIIAVLVLAVVAWSCSGVRREPGRAYMTDMGPSVALETYVSHDTLLAQGINYKATPVAGTIKRGELFPFAIQKDKQGDTANYVASKAVVNPLTALSEAQLKEAERLYLINCGICHGTKLDGAGPLHKRSDGTDGPYIAAPANLIGNATYLNMPSGQMYYSVTYGKGQMGSYASQLSTTQRWMVIAYIKAKQAEAKGGSSASAASADSTATAK
ncbi:MAG: cytochrome c [Candidatus Pseudobacter hemicellulosilyticus]|uniref:Cytochrome c n=1 Tax=Candidatus Pseudobacter hemicellulosilyticus TaxID=3121375 RepID=A0AAJ5WWB5_9BACT|nr:MAG: cytochrome c [Pseudobacter sp.]